MPTASFEELAHVQRYLERDLLSIGDLKAHSRMAPPRPSAASGLAPRGTAAGSFDDLIHPGQQGRRDRETEGLGGLAGFAPLRTRSTYSAMRRNMAGKLAPYATSPPASTYSQVVERIWRIARA